MRRFLTRHGHVPAARINMTPMIDITFLLLIFFMVTSHFASAEKVDVDLPHPDNNQSVENRIKHKVIVNLQRSEADEAARITVGLREMESFAQLETHLANIAEANPAAQVILRADRHLSYGQVREAMRAIAHANLRNLQIITELGPRK